MTFAEWCVANVVTIKKQLQSELKQERATYKRKTSEVGVAMKCHCGALYTTSETELRRGWGLSCSRKCSARRARRGLPAGRRLPGKSPCDE